MEKPKYCHVIDDDETRRVRYSCCHHCDHPGNIVEHGWECEDCDIEMRKYY